MEIDFDTLEKLYVPFGLKDKAKEMKCLYNPENKSWYIHKGNKNYGEALEMFSKVSLNVQYHQKDVVKMLGASWCKNEKKWVIPSMLKGKFQEYL